MQTIQQVQLLCFVWFPNHIHSIEMESVLFYGLPELSFLISISGGAVKNGIYPKILFGLEKDLFLILWWAYPTEFDRTFHFADTTCLIRQVVR